MSLMFAEGERYPMSLTVLSPLVHSCEIPGGCRTRVFDPTLAGASTKLLAPSAFSVATSTVKVRERGLLLFVAFLEMFCIVLVEGDSTVYVISFRAFP